MSEVYFFTYPCIVDVVTISTALVFCFLAAFRGWGFLCQLAQGACSSLKPVVGIRKRLNTSFYCLRQALIPGTILDLKL